LSASDEELARVEELCVGATRGRIAGESCNQIEKILSAIEIGDFVVISAPNDVAEPFYLEQVKFVADYNFYIHVEIT
jgi:hypothetical protein